jgi:hypothetical protein
VLTTFTSYGLVVHERQADILENLRFTKQTHTNLDLDEPTGERQKAVNRREANDFDDQPFALGISIRRTSSHVTNQFSKRPDMQHGDGDNH